VYKEFKAKYQDVHMDRGPSRSANRSTSLRPDPKTDNLTAAVRMLNQNALQSMYDITKKRVKRR